MSAQQGAASSAGRAACGACGVCGAGGACSAVRGVRGVRGVWGVRGCQLCGGRGPQSRQGGAAAAHQYGGDVIDGRPLVLQNVQADGAVGVDWLGSGLGLGLG